MSRIITIANEAELRQAARKLFAQEPVVQWQLIHFGHFDFAPKRERSADGVLILKLGDRRVKFEIKYKLAPTTRDLDWFARQPGQEPKLLIAPALSELLVKHCRERGINCADLNGRLWVQAGDFLIDRQPSIGPRFRAKSPAPDLFHLKSSRLVRTLLAHPKRRWNAQELVMQTGLSLALVYRLAGHLVAEGVLVREERHFRLQQFEALLDQWANQDNWTKRVTVRQYSLLTADLEEIAHRLVREFPKREQLAFTQWFAANLRYPYTTPPIVSAYISRDIDEKIEKKLRARQVSDGGSLWLILPYDDGVFRETQQIGDFVLACDVQIYLDLLPVGLRGPDQARALREWTGFQKATA